LPKSRRGEVGLTYLLARFADTLTDSGQWTLDDRLAHLTAWENAILQKNPSLWKLKGTLGTFSESEVQLLLIGGPLIEALKALSERSQDLSLAVLKTLISAMKWDLKTFSAATTAQPVYGCRDLATFDWYCVSIAGCVGAYWVKVFDLPQNLENLAIEYGKGLQRINILRDCMEDFQRGRVYLPQDLLKKFEIEETNFWTSITWRDFVLDYLAETRKLLRYGANFCDAIPYKNWRLRWASMMPVQIGLETLSKLESEILDPQSKTKISRAQVRALVWRTSLDVLLNRKLSPRIRTRGEAS